jgi:hypothetical protein
MDVKTIGIMIGRDILKEVTEITKNIHFQSIRIGPYFDCSMDSNPSFAASILCKIIAGTKIR